MDKLTELLEKFRSDEHWNTANSDGTKRFDKKLEWLEKMVKEYAEALHMTTDEVVTLMEEKRTYSWPNYYQEANFPGIDSNALYGVFPTFEDFHEESRKKWKGFRCPNCGDISSHPQMCVHRIHKDGKCDWCSYGLFQSGKGVVIMEEGPKLIPIFEPVPKDDEEPEQ